jgi:hypothetical protein
MRTEPSFQLSLVACGSPTTRRMPAATPPEVRWRRMAAVAMLAGVLTFPAAPADADPGTTELVSVSSGGTQGNFPSSSGALSDDGRFVAFASSATNLVPGDTNFADDIFVHDRHIGTTERVSVNSAGNQGNGHSGNFP